MIEEKRRIRIVRDGLTIETVDHHPDERYLRTKWGPGVFRLQLQEERGPMWVFISSRRVVIRGEEEARG